jgi:CHAT domain-containing protein
MIRLAVLLLAGIVPAARASARVAVAAPNQEQLAASAPAQEPARKALDDLGRALHVVLDDLLFLVPLDSLSLEGETRIGERIAIHVEPTLARLLSERRPLASGGRLVAVGGVDFEAAAAPAPQAASAPQGSPSVSEVPAPALGFAATPPLERSGRSEAFEPLRQTRYEVEYVGAQFAEAFEAEPLVLTGGAATKVALHAAAPRARFLHLATHGWFASESFKSQLDSLAQQGARGAFERAEATLTGFAPETLCGLALAGANRGKDSLGRVPGILTAEELASFDLRNCELAVLSACETNVGIRRAGQGIQSLQTALHAAGARTAITSLWKVDDAATRRLFELFYAKLWREKLGKAEALWQAKMALRAERHPLRDWAGWVLSGDPD